MNAIRILAFGDSITWGGDDTQGGWVDRIKRTLIKNFVGGAGKYQLINLGIGGNTSQDLLSRIESEIKVRQRDEEPILVVGIGVNDSRYVNEIGNPEVPIEVFKKNLQDIVDICKKYSSKILLVGLTSVAKNELHYKNYIYSNKRIAEYDAVISSVAKETRVDKLGLFEEFTNRKDLWSSDGLHPNDAGHELIEQLIQPKLIQ